MNTFDRIKQTARRVARRFVNATSVMLRGQLYDNATTTVENQRHWQNAREIAPIWANNPGTRRTLRERAAYEVANNCYCAGFVSTLAEETVGYVAPAIEVQTASAELNKFIADEWRRWSQSPEVNWPEKLNLLDRGRRVDGESFLTMTNDDDETRVATGFGLNVLVVPQRRVSDTRPNGFTTVEERQVTGPYGNTYTKSLINDDGVYTNAETGIPYEFLISSAADEAYGYTPGYMGARVRRVSARYCRQWFRPRSAGEFRGICEINPSLNLFAQLRRYGLAELSAAELAAMLALTLETNLPADDTGAPAAISPWSTREIERNTVTAMPEGWRMTQLQAQHPVTPYEMFVNMVLREIGRLMSMPFGIVAGDHSRYNYSSARLDVTGYDERKKFEREQLAIKVMNPVFREFLYELAFSDSRVRSALIESKWGIPFGWKFTNRPSIDPAKDAQVDDVRLKNGSTTFSEVYAARGLDWRTAVNQISQEQKIFSENNLNFPLDNQGEPATIVSDTPVAPDSLQPAA